MQLAIIAQIKAEIGARDWTRQDLALKAGVATSTLHRYLTPSEKRDIPLPVFADIAQALGMTALELASRAQRRLDGEDVR